MCRAKNFSVAVRVEIGMATEVASAKQRRANRTQRLAECAKMNFCSGIMRSACWFGKDAFSSSVGQVLIRAVQAPYRERFQRSYVKE